MAVRIHLLVTGINFSIKESPLFLLISLSENRHGKNGWRVELLHNSKGGGGGHGGWGHRGEDLRRYECGEPGHSARVYGLCIGSRGLGSGRWSSILQEFKLWAKEVHSSTRRSPRRCSVSPPRRGRSYSRSPDYHQGRRDSPYVYHLAAVLVNTAGHQQVAMLIAIHLMQMETDVDKDVICCTLG